MVKGLAVGGLHISPIWHMSPICCAAPRVVPGTAQPGIEAQDDVPETANWQPQTANRQPLTANSLKPHFRPIDLGSAFDKELF